MERVVWPCPAARAPLGLSVERGWRWCVQRTIRDARLAKARGRPISRSTLERLFNRRWQRLAARLPGARAWRGRRIVREHWNRLNRV